MKRKALLIVAGAQRGRRRGRAVHLPCQQGDRIPRLYGGRSRAGRLRAGRPHREAHRRGRRRTSSRAIRSSRWKARSRRLRSQRRAPACRKPRRGSPTSRPKCSALTRSRCSKPRSTRPRRCCRSRPTISTVRRRCSTRAGPPRRQLDDVIAQHDRNEAAVAEAEKRIIAAKLPGRSDMIDAAAANVEAARHALSRGREEPRQAQGRLRPPTARWKRSISGRARW